MLSSLSFMDHCEISGTLIWSECIHEKSCYYVPWSITGKCNWKPLVLSAFRATTTFTFLALHQAGSLWRLASRSTHGPVDSHKRTPCCLSCLWYRIHLGLGELPSLRHYDGIFGYFVILFFWLHWSVTLTATLLGPAVKWFGMTGIFSTFNFHLKISQLGLWALRQSARENAERLSD